MLEQGGDGSPTWAFAPDFYLPDHDRYLEVTTLNQKLVTRKHRKLRRLRELHPGIDISLLYQRDYLALLIKYGLEAPEQMDGDALGVRHLASEPLGLLGLGTLEAPGPYEAPAAG